MYRYTTKLKTTDFYLALIICKLLKMSPDELARVRAWLAQVEREGDDATVPVVTLVHRPSRN